jgi:hypothetical protein
MAYIPSFKSRSYLPIAEVFNPQSKPAIRNSIDLAISMGYDGLINKKGKLDQNLYMRRIVGSVSRIIKASPPAG